MKNLSKLNSHYYLGLTKCYGVTQDPNTQNYALVLDLNDGGLRKYLNQNYNSLTWESKFKLIVNICFGLINIHESDLIHKDLHIGNVLCNYGIKSLREAIICDFGICKPVNENLNSKKIYGVIPYMAPEILCGKEYTKAADVYSFGIIMNEIISITPPFNNEPHDHYLALDICRGKRPEIRNDTPDLLKNLIQRCWDAIPENRPTSEEISKLFENFDYENQCIELDKLSNNSMEELTTITSLFSKIQLETHPQTVYTSRLLNLFNLPEPINCLNQQEFVSSRPITIEVKGKFLFLYIFYK